MSGPSVVIDTACSSSLVAVYQACRALQNNDCSAAVAGGVNVICGPDMYLGLSRAHFLSPTGQCKPFDAKADGYSRGEGCGIFVLKRLSDAVAESDRILGIIKGIEVNQSGGSHSITHPHAETQTELFQRLLMKTHLDPSSISVVEAHGTGTQAGDFTEISSIHSTFASSRSSEPPLIVSSIKGNIGHTEAASGAAGLAKLLLMLRNKSIPVQASFENLNPRLNGLIGSGVSIPQETQTWGSYNGLPRRALLNNFGAAGSNAALILEEHLEPALIAAVGNKRSAYPFHISGKNAWALEENISWFKQFLSDRTRQVDIKDLCYTTSARRQLYNNRVSMVCNSIQDVLQQLKNPTIHSVPGQPPTRPMVFVFSGQGSSYFGMGKELMVTSPLFREIVTTSDTLLQTLNVEGTLRVLETEEQGSVPTKDEHMEVAFQCACCIVEYALARLLISWGINPDVLIGHSLGEYAALAISGAIAWEDSLRIVAMRAQLMTRLCTRNTSGMLAVRLSPESAESLISRSTRFSELSIACRNSVNDCVVSGGLEDLTVLEKECVSAGHKATRLKVPYGYHSKFMDPIVNTLVELGTSIAFLEPQIPVASTVVGGILSSSELNAGYFAKHARQSVQFLDTIQHLRDQKIIGGAIFLELGPHPITLPMIKSTLGTDSYHFISSLNKNQEPWVGISKALCELSVLGVNIKWRNVFDATNARFVEVTGHPLKKTVACVPYKERSAASNTQTNTSPAPGLSTEYSLLPTKLVSNPQDRSSIFETRLSVLAKYVCGHAVGGIPICPASVFVELALEAAHSIVPPTKDAAYLVRNLTFTSPLVYDSSKEHQAIRVTLTDPDSTKDINFNIASPATAADKESLFCAGLITTEKKEKTQGKWLRETAVVRRQQTHLFVNDGINLNTFQTKMIYERIFPGVVTYSSEYHTLISLSVAASGSEGYGSFRIPEQSPREGCIALPAFTDTLLHAAGFIANTSTRSVDAYICGKVETVQLLYDDLDLSETFTVYCSLFDDDKGTIMADTFALDYAGRVVAATTGLQFNRVRITAFKAALERTLAIPSDNQLSPSSPETSIESLAATPRDRAMKSHAVQTKVIDTIMKTCSVTEDAIRGSEHLAMLGIDSLMFEELLSTLQQAFPDRSVEMSVLKRCKSLHDLETAIESASTVSSLGTSTPASSVGEKRPSTITSQNEIDVSSRTRQILASVCDLNQSEIVPQKSLESLGIDSLLAIEMHSALCKGLNIDLSLEEVSHSQTVGDLESLARHSEQRERKPIKSDSHSKSQSPSERDTGLTQIQIGCVEKAPLYLFHDGSGLSNMYSRVDNLCRNLFGFSNPSAYTSRMQPATLVQMAADYAENLSASENSPVILGGWSFGGVVAFEAARALQDRGTQVFGVILIDSPYPLRHLPLPKPIIKHVIDTHSTYDTQETTKQKLISQFESNAALLASYTHTGSNDQLKSKAVYLRSKDTFDCKGLCGVEYPWLDNQQAKDEAIEKWRQLVAPGMKVLEIPGNHFEAFDKGNIPEVSKQLQKACELIQQEA